MRTTTVAGIVAYLVLALALIAGASPTQVIAGWAFFLVGAIAGLFLRLRFASEDIQVADDYGLEVARLYQTPLLSGMAAVLGVLLMASLAGSTLGDVITPEAAASPEPSVAASVAPASPGPAVSSPAASAGPSAIAGDTPASTDRPEQPTTATLTDAFNLGQYPIGLVIAVVFGLTPTLVLSRLGVSWNQVKKDLIATRPA
jgi:hypothetical protein